ncbi:hypothetical protein MNBD_GAMMA12-2680, partial [hydrothermal vent metagenome]
MEAIEREFIQQLKSKSIDQEFLLVYSDWLQERGDPRGEIIALEYALERGDKENRDRLDLQNRLDNLMQIQESALKLSAGNLNDITLTWIAGAVTKIEVNRDCLEALGCSITETVQFKFLTTINLSGLYLEEVPVWLGQLTQLTQLNLNKNNISELPESLGQLTQLTRLDLSDNNISELPESLGQLTQLTELYLADNNISELPESLGQLIQLTRLDLSDNNISGLPESLGQLTQLIKLYLDHNKISELPESLGQLTQLTQLGL